MAYHMEHRTYHPHRHPSPACRLRLVYKRRRTCRTTQQHPHLQLPPPSRPNPHLRHPPHSRTLRRTPPLPSSHSKPPQNPPLPIFHHLTHAPIQHTLQTLHSEHQLHRLTTDIDQLNELPLRTYAPWAWAQIILLIYLLILNHLQPTLLWPSTILLLSASFLLPLLGQRLGINLARRHSQLNEQRRHTLLQPLQALTQLLLWQRWEDYQHTYQQRQQQFDQLETRQQHLASLLIASQQTLLALTLLYTLSHAQLSPAILLALSLTLLGLNEILTPLASQFTSLGTSLSAKQRLNQLLIPPHHTHPKRPIPTKNLTLSAHQLSVQYPNAIAPLTNLNFIIKSGQTLLITGKSGSGKTTLLTTLAQEIPQKSGTLYLNHHPLHHYTPEHIAYHSQHIHIFNLTLSENLRLAHPNASDQQLWQALELVNLAHWVTQQPKHLHTPLGEYGLNLSGGQARRLALARHLLIPKPILILDEPFAGLDPENAQQLLEKLQHHMQHGLLIIASHQHPITPNPNLIHLQIPN